MKIELIAKDVTNMEVDAIVNAADESLLDGGEVYGAIHRAAGPKLLEETKTLNGCKVGEAKITKAYDLPSDYVIHTVGPLWEGGGKGEEVLLRNAYINSLELAKEYNLESVAFPLISSGAYKYPEQIAMEIAILTIEEFLEENDMRVFLVLRGMVAFDTARNVADEILY